jgi:hypothetical protein
MRELIDDRLYGTEASLLWEHFCACFFAMRVNALVLLGYTTCPFSALCKHAAIQGCDVSVRLRSMEVHAIQETLSPELPEVVTETRRHRRINWLRGSPEGVGYCLVNGTNGCGMDMFSALALDGSDGFCLYNAQQEGKSLGSVSAAVLLEKACLAFWRPTTRAQMRCRRTRLC